jgi:hypothetical protein
MTFGKASGGYDSDSSDGSDGSDGSEETEADEGKGGLTLFRQTRREILDLKQDPMHDIVTYPEPLVTDVQIPPAGKQAPTSDAMQLACVLESYVRNLKARCNEVRDSRAPYLEIVHTLEDILRTGKLLQRRQAEEIRALESRRGTFWDTFGDTSHPEIARLDRFRTAAEEAARRWSIGLEAVTDDIYWVSEILS